MTSCKKKHCDFSTVSHGTIITANSLVLTGNIVCKPTCDRGIFHHDEDKVEFVTVELTSPLLLIPGNAGAASVQPFYIVGDRVRVNVDQIVDVGPSNID